MGICLDTEANVSAQEEGAEGWKGGEGGVGSRRGSRLGTSESGQFPMQNGGRVKFDPPKVPVIFVLGGPGSGKVTHCDTLMQEKRGVTHINMMDLLQQYAIGNEMQDFSQLSSRTVTEVLMLEMKMAPAAKAYLVSGFPRSMRDVVEYQEKIGVVNGVILISWRQAVLQKQIDYGAKLGHVVLSLAKMELENFFKNVMPVADYFDQSDLLLAVNGERSPSEVYKDFRAAVLEVLSSQNNHEAEMNGVAGMGRGVDDIPGSIVSVDTAPSPQKVVTEQPKGTRINPVVDESMDMDPGMAMGQALNPQDKLPKGPIPPVIFVIGGPGSNKASLCLKVVGQNPGWTHFSVGRILRSKVEVEAKPNTESYLIKEAITEGEFVNQPLVDNLLETQLNYWRGKKGVLIDGYPRSMEQMKRFEEKFNQKPAIVLLDCSKLQLGRGRLDDTVSSFRRRLELFREQTLPMLKQMDNEGRLTIVDGDTDSPAVQREFEKVIKQNVQKVVQRVQTPGPSRPNEDDARNLVPGSLYARNQRAGGGGGGGGRQGRFEEDDAIVHDLEASPAKKPMVATISHRVGGGGGGGGGMANGHVRNGYGPPQNGHIPNGKPNFRNMLEEADNYPIHSYM